MTDQLANKLRTDVWHEMGEKVSFYSDATIWHRVNRQVYYPILEQVLAIKNLTEPAISRELV